MSPFNEGRGSAAWGLRTQTYIRTHLRRDALASPNELLAIASTLSTVAGFYAWTAQNPGWASELRETRVQLACNWWAWCRREGAVTCCSRAPVTLEHRQGRYLSGQWGRSRRPQTLRFDPRWRTLEHHQAVLAARWLIPPGPSPLQRLLESARRNRMAAVAVWNSYAPACRCSSAWLRARAIRRTAKRTDGSRQCSPTS